MPLTPPQHRSGPTAPQADPGEPGQKKKKIFLPPRVSMPVAGAAKMGFFAKLRAGGVGTAFFLFFMSISLAIVLFGVAGTVGPYRDALRRTGDPRFFYAAMGVGSLFILVASRMLQLMLTGVEAEARYKKKGKASEPWTWDYPWRPEGMGPDYAAAVAGSILGRIAFLSFIGFVNLAWESGIWLVRGIILVLDAFGLLIVFDSLRAVVQWLRFSSPQVAWKTFPAFLGDRLEGTIRFPRPLSPTGPAKVTLRCVKDEWTTREAPKGQTQSQLEATALHEEEQEIPLAKGRLERLDVTFELSDSLPGNLPGTRLDTEEAVYWQILLQVPTTGPDYEAIFLAPVYSRRR